MAIGLSGSNGGIGNEVRKFSIEELKDLTKKEGIESQ